MNCGLFEEVASDLARDRIMETERRESALAHARSCARCAARLADERALTGGLRALAESRQGRQAPPRVEAALLNTFRERSKSQTTNAAITEPSIPSIALADDIKGSRRRWRAVAGVAAAMLMIALISAIALVLAPEQSKQPAVGRTTPGPDEKADEKRAPAPPDSAEAAPAPDILGLDKSGLDKSSGSIAGRPSRPRAGSGQAGRRPGLNARAGDARAAEGSTAEVTTEFMPLTYGDNTSQMASGHIVRVELPRSAMASFGLPVNHERAESRVKADVLIGEDGLARAIRFVR
ncbi:MAG TPA: hypothetical protein VKC34_18390 [Blastocatellia bacterium]|nr:hypothetical protein [Blastocatellia bacterium]